MGRINTGGGGVNVKEISGFNIKSAHLSSSYTLYSDCLTDVDFKYLYDTSSGNLIRFKIPTTEDLKNNIGLVQEWSIAVGSGSIYDLCYVSGDGTVYSYEVSSHKLYCHSATGNLLWEKTVPNPYSNFKYARTYIADNGDMYLLFDSYSNNQHHLTCYDANGNIRYEKTINNPSGMSGKRIEPHIQSRFSLTTDYVKYLYFYNNTSSNYVDICAARLEILTGEFSHTFSEIQNNFRVRTQFWHPTYTNQLSLYGEEPNNSAHICRVNLTFNGGGITKSVQDATISYDNVMNFKPNTSNYSLFDQLISGLRLVFIRPEKINNKYCLKIVSGSNISGTSVFPHVYLSRENYGYPISASDLYHGKYIYVPSYSNIKSVFSALVPLNKKGNKFYFANRIYYQYFEED